MARLRRFFRLALKSLPLFLILKTNTYASTDEAATTALNLKETNSLQGFHIVSALPERKIMTARVSIVKGYNLYAMTREAINLIGGMKKIVKPGDKVFIKPNYISGGLDGHDPVSAGEIAHPLVVASVAEECLKAGAKEVVIGEWVERPVKINFGGKEGKEGAQVKGLVDRLNKKYGNRIYLINLMDHTSYFKFVWSIRFIR